MKYLKYLLFSGLLVVLSCSTNYQHIDYANGMKNCLGAENVKMLNKLCFIFEKKMQEHYELSDTEELYDQFITDIYNSDLSSRIIKNQDIADILLELKNHELLEVGWMRSADYYRKFTDRPWFGSPFGTSSHYVINVRGKMYQCLMKSENTNKALVIIHNSLKFGPDKNRRYLAEELINQGSIDYSNKNTRLAIALAFFYSLAFDLVVFE